MNRIIVFLVLLIVLIAALAFGWWAYTLPGKVTVPIGTEEISIKSGAAVALVLALSGIMAAAWWIISGIFVLPGRIARSRRQSKSRKANAALTEGLLAAEAGDAEAALKLARKAAKHAEDERLKLLLEARAAEANDDWAGAERAWSQLTRLPGGQLAGLRGSAMAASERGDQLTAETRAREASASNPPPTGHSIPCSTCRFRKGSGRKHSIRSRPANAGA
jgi:HemY protein